MNRISICGGLVLLAGCLGPEKPDTMWASQVDAALMNPDIGTRESTLATLAKSAAYTGDAESARYALDQLPAGARLDEALAECARQFSGSDPGLAARFADRIGDDQRRETILGELRKTESENK